MFQSIGDICRFVGCGCQPHGQYQHIDQLLHAKCCLQCHMPNGIGFVAALSVNTERSCTLLFLGGQINDLAFEAVQDPDSGQLMFNVLVGGYFSGQRNIMSVPLGCAVTEEQVIPFSVALLRVFR